MFLREIKSTEYFANIQDPFLKQQSHSHLSAFRENQTDLLEMGFYQLGHHNLVLIQTPNHGHHMHYWYFCQ